MIPKNYHDLWYINGSGLWVLERAGMHGSIPDHWDNSDMDRWFLKKTAVEAENGDIQICWESFHSQYGHIARKLSPRQIHKLVVAFSRDPSVIVSTESICRDAEARLGVQLATAWDRLDAGIPNLLIAPALTAETFFFDHFLPSGLPFVVKDPLKFASWVLQDRRWGAWIDYFGKITTYSQLYLF